MIDQSLLMRLGLGLGLEFGLRLGLGLEFKLGLDMINLGQSQSSCFQRFMPDLK